MGEAALTASLGTGSMSSKGTEDAETSGPRHWEAWFGDAALRCANSCIPFSRRGLGQPAQGDASRLQHQRPGRRFVAPSLGDWSGFEKGKTVFPQERTRGLVGGVA